jgi:hypothetical protein
MVRFVARLEPSLGVSCLIVPPKDMVELETIEFLFRAPYLLSVCRHARVATTRLSHHMIDDELRVTMDVKPLNPKFGGDAQTISQGLVLHHIVGSA